MPVPTDPAEPAGEPPPRGPGRVRIAIGTCLGAAAFLGVGEILERAGGP